MDKLQFVCVSDMALVVRCRDCKYCTLLPNGNGFTCTEWDVDFYSPHYDAATYFCADGVRKENNK